MAEAYLGFIELVSLLYPWATIFQQELSKCSFPSLFLYNMLLSITCKLSPRGQRKNLNHWTCTYRQRLLCLESNCFLLSDCSTNQKRLFYPTSSKQICFPVLYGLPHLFIIIFSSGNDRVQRWTTPRVATPSLNESLFINCSCVNIQPLGMCCCLALNTASQVSSTSFYSWSSMICYLVYFLL